MSERHDLTLLYAELRTKLAQLPARDLKGGRRRLFAEYAKFGVRPGSYYKFTRTRGGTRRSDAGQMRKSDHWQPVIEQVFAIQTRMSDFEAGRWTSAETALTEAARCGLIRLKDEGGRMKDEAREVLDADHQNDRVQNDRPVLSVRNYNQWVKKLRLKVPRGFHRFQAEYSNQVHQFDVSGATSLQVVQELDDGDFLLMRRPPRERLSKVQRKAGWRLWMGGLVDDYSGVFGFQYFVAAGEDSASLRMLLDQMWRGLDPEFCLRGLPDILYVDNGSFAKNSENIPYLSQEMGVGVELQTALPYNARAKGKIERQWRTVKSNFETAFLSDSKPEWKLSDVNRMAVQCCIELARHGHRYASESRATVYQAGFRSPARIPADDALATAHKIFKRRVDGSGLLTLDNVIYEVPLEFRSQTVIVYRNAGGAVVIESQITGQRVEAEVWQGAHKFGEFRGASETEIERTAKSREAGEWGRTQHPYSERMKDEGGRMKVVPFIAADKEESKESPFTEAARFADPIDAKKWVARELGIGLLALNEKYPTLREQLNQLLGRTLNREEIAAWIEGAREQIYGGEDLAAEQGAGW